MHCHELAHDALAWPQHLMRYARKKVECERTRESARVERERVCSARAVVIFL